MPDTQIDVLLDKLLSERPELAGGNLKEIRSRLATTHRPAKQKDITRAELEQLWDSQTTEVERALLRGLASNRTMTVEPTISAKEAVEWAEEHLFDRNSVVLECQVWQEALGRARSENLSVSQLIEFTRQRGYIRDEARPGEVTLRDVLLREWEIVQTAKDGVAACHPLVTNPPPANPSLDDEQRQALNSLLRSTSRISIFRGGAGTGKSFILRELVEQVQRAGRSVVVLVLQRQQVVEMEKAGLPAPATIASFLTKHELVDGAVVVVDEAGQIGGRQMLELIRIVQEQNARLLLSGDTRQHVAVAASDALLAIERHSGVKPIELCKVRRQDPGLA